MATPYKGRNGLYEKVIIMKKISRDGFKLPFIGKDKFAELMRIGVGYDKKNRLFFIRNKANLEIIREILTDIFKEKVKFEELEYSKTQTCALCMEKITCHLCEYYSLCQTRELAFNKIGLYCMCVDCSRKDGSYLEYAKRSL